ncbi:Protein of uncharacterised function (DUF2631) [Mycolicibacterium aurum]|uniref:Protein of uncharacterized function (DUF2631) n=1 Tax=Mycolicibacterium aurum TaxID=1791 RepID=A0A3S4VL14_MYCAU|nr:DUF2631 domain-containing protein [Mycolicibacterium aurum]VEG53739.1 Protein of uncharacterised function (DUF2631) [Mycolicibacterium aurum]
MASTEVERRSGVDVEEVPSAEWGWSTGSLKGFQIGGTLAALFLLAMMHGNHSGKVEDLFLIGFALVLFGVVARSVYTSRNRDTR